MVWTTEIRIRRGESEASCHRPGTTRHLVRSHRADGPACDSRRGRRRRHVIAVGQVIGDLLPFAVGVAISPIPIIAVILMLLAPKAGGTSAGFLVGWLIGIAGTTTVFLLLAGILDQGTDA